MENAPQAGACYDLTARGKCRWEIVLPSEQLQYRFTQHTTHKHTQNEIEMHRVTGVWNRRRAPERARALLLPALAVSSSALFLLAALTALLGGGLASPVLATPLPVGTSAGEVPVEDATFTLVDCCEHTATLLQDNTALQRSLAQCADSLAASEARALGWERTARRLQLESCLWCTPYT